MKLVTIK